MSLKTSNDLKRAYVSQKTKDLKEFGYPNLTREEVAEQYDKVMAGDKELNVIGMFIKSDVENARAK